MIARSNIADHLCHLLDQPSTVLAMIPVTPGGDDIITYTVDWRQVSRLLPTNHQAYAIIVATNGVEYEGDSKFALYERLALALMERAREERNKENQ